MSSYLFYQSGSIPGIPGTFAHCRVDVGEDGTLTQSPLPLAPHSVAEPAQDEERDAPVTIEKSKKKSAPAE